MKKLFSTWWRVFDSDTISEGLMAHEYQDSQRRAAIRDRYLELYRPQVTPLTDPLKFDPLDPPQGWAWDPYYECWLKTE
jgi:hypothetical protein